LTDNGYKLVYQDAAPSFFKASERGRKVADLSYSVGLVVGKDAEITAVIWEGPAFKAGLSVGTTIVAVNGMSYSDDRFREAIVAAKGKKEPIRLTVKKNDVLRDVAVAWNGGPRYPTLQKTGTGETGLDRLLAAK
jgi:predicted metalloprotease with PDZ domain